MLRHGSMNRLRCGEGASVFWEAFQAPIVALTGGFWGMLISDARTKRRTIHVTAPDTRIFSPHAVAGLCVTIGRYWYLFKGLTALPAGRFSRFEHMETYSSGKVGAK
jgi:hypothetical protein